MGFFLSVTIRYSVTINGHHQIVAIVFRILVVLFVKKLVPIILKDHALQ